MEEYSVLMPVYYKENPQYLSESIKSMLTQTIRTNDFVLICDGPLTAELDKVIDVFEKENPDIFRIVRLPENVGIGKALNIGLNHCKNEYVARMDSDDISYPDRCSRQLKILLNDNVDIVSGTVEEFYGDVDNIICKRILPQRQKDILHYAKRRNPFNHPCIMYRKTAVLASGGYQHFYLFEDYYLWVRMLINGAKGYNIDEPILYMRSGTAMYQRRGGIKYIYSMIRFRWYLKKNHFSGWLDFLISTVGQALVCLFPNRIRIWVYKRFLRKLYHI